MQKTILVTGAGGFLGNEILNQLLNEHSYDIIALDLKKENIKSCFRELNKLSCYSIDEWERNEVTLKHIDILIHAAFSRSYDGEKLAGSLDFTRSLFSKAAQANVNGIINISSQSVYGPPYKPLWTEKTPVTANSLYALAKYSTELIANATCNAPGIKTHSTNIRLASLIGPGLEERLVNKFVKNALSGNPINIVGGKQIFSFMDVRDAASGIISLVFTETSKWKNVYNLGNNSRNSLLEIAEIVQKTAAKYINKPVEIIKEDKDVQLHSGMDSSLLYQTTGWNPKYDLVGMVENLFNFYLNK